MHTYKNGLLIDDNCSILFLSETYPGNVHDKKIADASNIELPSGSALLQDTGFQGYSLKGVEIIQPFKKRKNCCLSLFDNILNQVISSSRVYIEHVIGSVKRCQVVSGVCRLKGSPMSDLVMEVCCGLHNLRVSVVIPLRVLLKRTERSPYPHKPKIANNTFRGITVSVYPWKRMPDPSQIKRI